MEYALLLAIMVAVCLSPVGLAALAVWSWRRDVRGYTCERRP